MAIKGAYYIFIIFFLALITEARHFGSQLARPRKTDGGGETSLGEEIKEDVQHIKQLLNEANTPLDSLSAKADEVKESEPCLEACPDGWKTHEEFCYLYEGTRTGSVTNARQICERLGADLPIIESADENEFIANLIKEQPVTANVASFVRKAVWIGLERKDDGKFYWVDGTPLEGNYEAWFPGEPNNAKGNEDCVFMDGPQAKWNDDPCNWSETPAVLCQREREFMN